MEAELARCIIPLSYNDTQHSGFILSGTASTYLPASLLNKKSLEGLYSNMHVYLNKKNISKNLVYRLLTEALRFTM